METRLTSSFWAETDAALAQQVTEHKETDQRQGYRGDKAGDHADDDREEDLRRLRHLAGLVLHTDPTLFFSGNGLDGDRLDDGDQRHVGVGRDHDGAHIF